MAMNTIGMSEIPQQRGRRPSSRSRRPVPSHEFKTYYDASDTLEFLGQTKHFRINQVKALQAAVTHLDQARAKAENDPGANPSLPLRLATTSTFASLIAHVGRLKAHCDDERFMGAYEEIFMAPIPEKLEEIGVDLLDRFSNAHHRGDKVAQKDYATFAHELTLEMLMFSYGNPREFCLPHNFSRLNSGIAAHSLRYPELPSHYLKIDGPEPHSPHDPAVIDSSHDLQNTADAKAWEGLFPPETPFPTLMTLLDNDGPDADIKDIILTGIAYDLKKKIFSS